METIVFGDVLKHWRLHNPRGLPTILWAPGVDSSAWFAQQFREKGITATHIDGSTDDEERKFHFAASKAGDLSVICSCGVLREGVDLPWVACGILVQPCVALSTFIQIAGRLLRAHPNKTKAILIDHAGAWHRHGSPNADREWSLDDTDQAIAKRVKEARQAGEVRQPICCPKCSGVRAAGPICPYCQHKHVRSVRSVRMTDGKLVRMVGDVVKRKQKLSGDQKEWRSCLYAAAASGRTIAQAAGDFQRRTGHALPVGLENVPPRGRAGDSDWERKAGAVFPWLLKRKAVKS